MTNRQSCDPAIELVGLTKRFGRKAVVRDLSLRVDKGSTLGLIGPNGAGKSTTIKMLMGLTPITAGRATVLGMDVAGNANALKQRVGYVPEQHFIYRWMRVGEVIRFCRRLYKIWNDELCESLLDLFELDCAKKVKHLSKGMLAKLSLLLAISHEPELLILDEPTAGLDPIAREEFLDGVLRTVVQRGQTVLFSSHTLSDVQRMADTVGIIDDGELLAHRPVDELLAGTKRIRAVLQDGHLPRAAPQQTIWQRVQRREWLLTVKDFSPEVVQQVRESNPVETVEVTDLGLEEIFKDYIKGRRAAR